MMTVGLNLNTFNSPSFGNQTQRGKLAKSINQIESALSEYQLPESIKNKIARKSGELKKIQKTRWEYGNERYQGKDKKNNR